MTITISLSSEQEDTLLKVARKEHVELEDVVSRLISARCEEAPERDPEADADRVLMAAGLLRRLPTGVPDPAIADWAPIPVTGEPVSETILQDRR